MKTSCPASPVLFPSLHFALMMSTFLTQIAFQYGSWTLAQYIYPDPLILLCSPDPESSYSQTNNGLYLMGWGSILAAQTRLLAQTN